MQSHLSDEEWNSFVNSPEARAHWEDHLANIIAEYSREELIEIGYLNEAGEVIEPNLAGAIPYRGHFRELNWSEKWKQRKIHLIERKLKNVQGNGRNA